MAILIDINTAPRGVRNNNPGNIEYNIRNKWKGMVGKDSRFCIFETPELGLRALMKLLRNYRLKTVSSIISRWAPSNENDTSAYVKHVADLLMVNPLTRLHIEERGTLISLAKAIVRHENGCNPYTDDIYESAYELL